MNSAQYLLPLLAIFPFIFLWLYISNARMVMSPALFAGPVLFTGLALLCAITGQTIAFNPWDSSTYFTLGLRLDALSGLIAATVSTIGIVVARFSVRYLEDDPKRVPFFKNLTFTLSFVLSMIMAPNLVLFFFSWLGTSYFLHRLLIHFSDRPAAIAAARQKFWVSRLGDAFIVLAGALLLATFKSLEFPTIFRTATDNVFIEQNYLAVNLASIFLVLGAMTKSAQFPFHFWLPNTLETPTPVSALMHAGIINAGGYLVVRMSPLLSQTPAALSILAIFGGFTAFWAAIVMFTQTSIKKSLAYSTISQMGFMMLQCGLGAFSIAVVHIIGHAFYKAYAFLSSGTATDFGRLNRYFPQSKKDRSAWAPLSLGAFSVAFILGGLSYAGYRSLENPGTTVLLVILALAVAQIVLSGRDRLKSIAYAGFIVLLYLGLSNGMSHLLAESVASKVFNYGQLGNFTFYVCASFFAALYLFQNYLEKLSETQFGKRIYVRALSGGF